MSAIAPAAVFVSFAEVYEQCLKAIPELDRMSPPAELAVDLLWRDIAVWSFKDIAKLLTGIDREAALESPVSERSQRVWREVLGARDWDALRLVIEGALDEWRAGHLAEPLIRAVAALRWVHRRARRSDPDEPLEPQANFVERYVDRVRRCWELPPPPRQTASVFIEPLFNEVWQEGKFRFFTQRQGDLEPQHISHFKHVLRFDGEWFLTASPSPRPRHRSREARERSNREAPPRWENLAVPKADVQALIKALQQRVRPMQLPRSNPRGRDDQRAIEWLIHRWLPKFRKQVADDRQPTFAKALEAAQDALAAEQQRRELADRPLPPLGDVSPNAFRERVWSQAPAGWHDPGAPSKANPRAQL